MSFLGHSIRKHMTLPCLILGDDLVLQMQILRVICLSARLSED